MNDKLILKTYKLDVGRIFNIWDSLQHKFHKAFAEELIYGTSTIDYTEEVELLKQTKDE